MARLDGSAIDEDQPRRRFHYAPADCRLRRPPRSGHPLYLLTCAPLLRGRPKSWAERHLRDTGGNDYPKLLRRDDCSTGERLVAEAATSVFGFRPDGNNTIAVNLLDVRAGFNEASRRAVFEAIETALWFLPPRIPHSANRRGIRGGEPR